jgi:response regulator RpfG family c-di-GMP phosphodiesterase
MASSIVLHCLGAVSDTTLKSQLERFFSSGGFFFEPFSEASGLFEKLCTCEVDFIILDPTSLKAGDSGRTNLSWFVGEARKIKPGLPILALLPPLPDEELKGSAYASGVTDFISLPLSETEFTFRIRSLAQMVLSRKRHWDSFVVHESEIQSTIREIMIRETETLYVLGRAAEYKDRETGCHIERVAHYSQAIARVIGMPAQNQDILFHSSALHDIGKISIPDAVLLKPGKLLPEEFEIMKTHSILGYGILKDTQSAYLLNGAMIALTHHEKYDGSGYPMGLAGEDIPLFGRIVGIADVFDALTTKRPYKNPWTLADAFAYVEHERGKQFDPVLADAFLSNSLGVEWIFNNHADLKTA